MKTLLIILIASGMPLLGQVRKGIALSKDKTGMKWVAPFEDATAVALKNKRILMVKPIAFGTDKKGCW